MKEGQERKGYIRLVDATKIITPWQDLPFSLDECLAALADDEAWLEWASAWSTTSFHRCRYR